MYFNFRIAPEPGLLRIKNSREFEVESRWNCRRASAAASAARLPAFDQARSLERRLLQCTNGVSVLVARVAGARHVHRLIETSLDREDRECRLRGRNLPVERHFLTGLVERSDRRPLIQLRHHQNVGLARP